MEMAAKRLQARPCGANAGLLRADVTRALTAFCMLTVHSGTASWCSNLRRRLVLARAPRFSLPQTDERGGDAGSRQPQLVDAIVDHPAVLVCLRTGQNTASASFRMTIPRGQQCPEPANQVSFLLCHEPFHERTPSAELPSRVCSRSCFRQGKTGGSAVSTRSKSTRLARQRGEKNQLREKRTRANWVTATRSSMVPPWNFRLERDAVLMQMPMHASWSGRPLDNPWATSPLPAVSVGAQVKLVG